MKGDWKGRRTSPNQVRTRREVENFGYSVLADEVGIMHYEGSEANSIALKQAYRLNSGSLTTEVIKVVDVGKQASLQPKPST